jgi:hypothetical protein
MSKSIHGSGEVGIEFDKRIEMIEELRDESAAIAVRELLDWINNDSKVRRNLDAKRYEKLLDYLDQASDHAAWEKVAVMLQTRQAQNSVARKNELILQREAERGKS